MFKIASALLAAFGASVLFVVGAFALTGNELVDGFIVCSQSHLDPAGKYGEPLADKVQVGVSPVGPVYVLTNSIGVNELERIRCAIAYHKARVALRKAVGDYTADVELSLNQSLQNEIVQIVRNSDRSVYCIWYGGAPRECLVPGSYWESVLRGMGWVR